MAHVGKYYPRFQPYDIALITVDGWVPPRKMRYSNNGAFHVGTLTTPWINADILSDVGEISSDRTFITYKFNHPSVDDNYIECKWFLRYLAHPVPDSRRPRIVTNFSFWFEGTNYGDQEREYTSDVFLGTTRECFQWLAWSNLADPTKFQQLGLNRAFAGLWSEQPEYHPYRA